MKVTQEFAAHNLGGIIKAARMEKKLTREQLAERVDIGPRHLMGIENKNKTPGFDLLFHIIRELEIPAEKIFYPEIGVKSSDKERLVRMIYRCGDRDIRAVTALVETFLDEQG